MNFLISMNNKMFKQSDSKKLIDNIIKLDTNKSVKGAEIYIDMRNDDEKKYCLNLAKRMKDKDWILQIHSVDMYKLENVTIDEYLKYYNDLAIIYGSKIKLTVHASENIESISKDREALIYIHKCIVQNKYNLEVLIENLNSINEIKRCNIYDVYEIIDNEIMGITLDIGHYVYDYSNDYTNLYISHKDKIKNIHLHDINNKVDHYPFYFNKVNLQKVANFLKDILYNKSVVLEFALEYLEGDTFKDKIKEYIKQIEYVKRYIKY